MDRSTMVFTRWIRLIALLVAVGFMVYSGGTLGYTFAAVCLVFIGMTLWQLYKLYRDERYRS